MKTFKITKMSGKGDEMVAEWNETTAPDRLGEIEKEFNAMMAKGYHMADLATNEIVKAFKPDTDYLAFPAMAGGAH